MVVDYDSLVGLGGRCVVMLGVLLSVNQELLIVEESYFEGVLFREEDVLCYIVFSVLECFYISRWSSLDPESKIRSNEVKYQWFF